MSRPGRMLHLFVVIALCATTLLPVTATLAQRPATERWSYLFLLVPEEGELTLVHPPASRAEQADNEAMDEEISRMKSLFDGWEEMNAVVRIHVYMNVLGDWGWEVVPLELPYEPRTLQIIVFKRPG